MKVRVTYRGKSLMMRRVGKLERSTVRRTIDLTRWWRR